MDLESLLAFISVIIQVRIFPIPYHQIMGELLYGSGEYLWLAKVVEIFGGWLLLTITGLDSGLDDTDGDGIVVLRG